MTRRVGEGAWTFEGVARIFHIVVGREALLTKRGMDGGQGRGLRHHAGKDVDFPRESFYPQRGDRARASHVKRAVTHLSDQRGHDREARGHVALRHHRHEHHAHPEAGRGALVRDVNARRTRRRRAARRRRRLGYLAGVQGGEGDVAADSARARPSPVGDISTIRAVAPWWVSSK